MNTSSLVQNVWSFCHTLRAAFAGQLVPQDPNDDSASVLIERIRALRSASAASDGKPARRARKRGDAA